MGFGRSKPTATGRAELLSEKETKWLADSAGSPGGSTSTASRHTVWRVRVVPDDGRPEFESKLSIWGKDTSGGLERGMKYYPWTYVRYDASAPDSCELDMDRLEKEFGRGFKGHKRVTIPATGVAGINQQAAEALVHGDSAEFRRLNREAITAQKQVGAASRSGPVAAAGGASTRGVADELVKLADLRDRGVLTQAEFEAQKAKLLGEQ